MGIDIVFRIAGIGILVAVACQLLTMVIGLIATLFGNVRSVFELY